MVADPQWLLKLFREDHWENSDHPLRPPIAGYAFLAVLEDEVLGVASRGSPVKMKRDADVSVLHERGTSRPSLFLSGAKKCRKRVVS